LAKVQISPLKAITLTSLYSMLTQLKVTSTPFHMWQKLHSSKSARSQLPCLQPTDVPNWRPPVKQRKVVIVLYKPWNCSACRKKYHHKPQPLKPLGRLGKARP